MGKFDKHFTYFYLFLRLDSYYTGNRDASRTLENYDFSYEKS